MTIDAQDRRIALLEERLLAVEDRLAILQLIATYGPAVDSRSAEETAALWAPDGFYDFGGTNVIGAEAVGRIVDLDTHVGYVEKGCTHVMALPMITIDGDRATATGYSRVYLHDGNGWKVERASANHWDLVRTPAGWKVQGRTNRLMDGSAAGREILAEGLKANHRGTGK